MVDMEYPRPQRKRPDMREIDAIRAAHYKKQQEQQAANEPAQVVRHLDTTAEQPPKERIAYSDGKGVGADEFKPPVAPVIAEPAEYVPTAPDPSVVLPDKWREMNWTELRDIARKISGQEIRSRSEARTALLAHEAKGMDTKKSTPPSAA